MSAKTKRLRAELSEAQDAVGDLSWDLTKTEVERDALKAANERFRAVVADVQRCQEMADPSERMRCGMCCNDHFADLAAALDAAESHGGSR
jgi:hypothetical protein